MSVSYYSHIYPYLRIKYNIQFTFLVTTRSLPNIVFFNMNYKRIILTINELALALIGQQWCRKKSAC